MLDALYIAAIGLQVQKQRLDVLANNMANVGTTAFKRQSIDFSGLLDRAPLAGGANGIGSAHAPPNRVLRFDSAPGDIHQTGRPLDVAVAGPGFIEVELPGDRIGYSRAGSLQVRSDGALAHSSGHALKADIQVPAGASDVRILADGSVTATLAGEATPTTLGQIELAVFANPEALEYRGDGIFTAADDVELTHARPGEDGTQSLAVQSLESSNIKMTEEMVSLMLMQRIYELNSRVVQVADELIGMSNNMRRG